MNDQEIENLKPNVEVRYMSNVKSERFYDVLQVEYIKNQNVYFTLYEDDNTTFDAVNEEYFHKFTFSTIEEAKDKAIYDYFKRQPDMRDEWKPERKFEHQRIMNEIKSNYPELFI